MKLRKCACGKSPDHLDVVDGSTYRWKYAVCGACGEWTIEFRVAMWDDDKAIMEKGEKAWNEAPRGDQNDD